MLHLELLLRVGVFKTLIEFRHMNLSHYLEALSTVVSHSGGGSVADASLKTVTTI